VDNKNTTFSGQQEGERILYVLYSHPFICWYVLLKIVLLFALFAAAWFRGGPYVAQRMPGSWGIGWALIIGTFIVTVWWNLKLHLGTRAFVTDRRVIRFRPSFPVTETKRMIFWRDVLKTKTLADNVFSRLLKVGTLEVVPKTGGELSLLFPYVHYYEDLGHYFDKLVYLTNAEPQGLKGVRAFVALPKWERYEEDAVVHEVEPEEQAFLQSPPAIKEIGYVGQKERGASLGFEEKNRAEKDYYYDDEE
jgi:hypothetical protein